MRLQKKTHTRRTTRAANVEHCVYTYVDIFLQSEISKKKLRIWAN